MEYNLTDLLILFDEVKDLDNEESEWFWLSSRRDGFIITLTISKYESRAGVFIQTINNIGVASVDLNECDKIRVLDLDRKCLEILHNSGTGRCFISLLEGPIMSYDDNYHRPI